jgi:uncharacterized protein (DUF2267 family)
MVGGKEKLMNYDEFMTLIEEQAGLAHEEAETTARAVMCALAEVIPAGRAQAVRGYLPVQLAQILERSRPEPDALLDEHIFLGWLVSDLDTTGRRDKTVGGIDLMAVYGGEEAWRRCRCVFVALKSCLGEAGSAALADGLPAWMCGRFLEA